jgi:hypothetical protein
MGTDTPEGDAVKGESFRLIVGGIIVGVWIASLIVDAVVPAYEVPVTVHGAMMLVAGYLFAPAIYRRNGAE